MRKLLKNWFKSRTGFFSGGKGICVSVNVNKSDYLFFSFTNMPSHPQDYFALHYALSNQLISSKAPENVATSKRLGFSHVKYFNIFTESPSQDENASTSSTPQGDETQFTFYENGHSSELLGNSTVKLEPVLGMSDQGHLRCRRDLSVLVRAVMSSEEQFPIENGIEDENPEDDFTPELYVKTEEELLSDGCEAAELSPLSDYADNDCWWWVSRSPSVPSARRLPQYLEDKENIFAQIKRSEKNRQNICENINRLRKEAKRGLTQARKDRYATIMNHKLIQDAESVLNSACTSIKAATEIDGLQESLRDQLLSIQKTYRERHRELAKLTPRNKDK